MAILQKGQQKMLLIEIDGMTWDILSPLLREKQLPNFASLLEQGSYGILQSLEEPLFSPTIWTSIISGKVPEKHGIGQFGITSQAVKCKRLWDILTEKEWRCGIYGHLVTWPPPQLDCFSVPDFLAHGSETIPPELEFVKKLAMHEKMEGRQSLAQYAQYGIQAMRHGMQVSTAFKIAWFLLSTKVHRPPFLENFYRKRFLAADMNSDVFTYMYKTTRPDFSIFYTNIVDACCHMFWKFMEPDQFDDVSPREVKRFGHVITMAYQKADTIIGKLLQQIDEDTNVMVVSDHGFQVIPAAEKFPHGLIKSSRLLEFLGLAEHFSAANMAWAVFLREKRDSGKGTEWIKTLLQSVRLKETGLPVFDIGEHNNKNISVRLSQVHYMKLQKPTLAGCTICTQEAEIPFEDLISEGDTKISGTHHQDGVFIIKGPHIKRDYRAARFHVLDVTPTLLVLAGLPVAKDMDGNVMEELFQPEYLEQQPISYIETYESAEGRADSEDGSFEESEIVKQRLRELGYIT